MFCDNSGNLTKQFRGGTFKHLAYLSSSEKVLFAIHCLFCVSVQRMVILLNLTVISVFDCLIWICKSSNKQIDYRIQLAITISVLGITASLFGPFLKVLNTRHKFFPLGDFFKDIDVLFGQRRKESVNPITLQVFLFLKFLQNLSDFIPWFWSVFNFKAMWTGYENPLFPAHLVKCHFGIILLADFLYGIWRQDAGF